MFRIKKLFNLNFIVILILILQIAIIYTNNANAEDPDIDVITWRFDYTGKVHSFIVYDGRGSRYLEVGYADGNGNYYIDGCSVLINQTLIIEPGITVHFIHDYDNQFIIYGSIIAQGTRSKPISFTSNDSDPKVASWTGFEIRNPGNGPVIFEYCNFSYSYQSEIYRDVIFRNCTFHSTLGLDNGINIPNNIILEYCICGVSA